MDEYYALMIDASGVTRAIKRLESEDDLAAIEAAKGALECSPQYVATEIWRGRERVGKVLGPRATPLEHWTMRHRRGMPQRQPQRSAACLNTLVSRRAVSGLRMSTAKVARGWSELSLAAEPRKAPTLA